MFISLRSERVIFHKLPDNSKCLYPALEGIHVAPVCIAMHDLLAFITASPNDAIPAIHAVHVSGVVGALEMAVHGGEEIREVDHLIHVIVSVIRYDGPVRSRSEVAGTLRGVRDDVIKKAVEVDNVYRGVWSGSESPEWGGCYWPQ